MRLVGSLARTLEMRQVTDADVRAAAEVLLACPIDDADAEGRCAPLPTAALADLLPPVLRLSQLSFRPVRAIAAAHASNVRS